MSPLCCAISPTLTTSLLKKRTLRSNNTQLVPSIRPLSVRSGCYPLPPWNDFQSCVSPLLVGFFPEFTGSTNDEIHDSASPRQPCPRRLSPNLIIAPDFCRQQRSYSSELFLNPRDPFPFRVTNPSKPTPTRTQFPAHPRLHLLSFSRSSDQLSFVTTMLWRDPRCRICAPLPLLDQTKSRML